MKARNALLVFDRQGIFVSGVEQTFVCAVVTMTAEYSPPWLSWFLKRPAAPPPQRGILLSASFRGPAGEPGQSSLAGFALLLVFNLTLLSKSACDLAIECSLCQRAFSSLPFTP